MFYRRAKIDLASVHNDTYFTKERIRAAEVRYANYTTDPEKKERLAEQECIVCWYESKIGGAAMTSRQCGFCSETVHCGNTAIDKLCLKCAQENELCKHCGSDIGLRLKRRTPVTQATETLPETY